MIKRVAAVNDLSGFGRCSLTVALPILSAMGAEVCPVPTAILSAHTGYPHPHIHDLTGDMTSYLDHWKELGLVFDAVYTGFLGNEAQADALAPFLKQEREKGALCLVDPAMADHGQLYSTCTVELVNSMRRLVEQATVTTPNLTEACLLTGMDYGMFCQSVENDHVAEMNRLCDALMTVGCQSAVITGVSGENNRLENWVATKQKKCCVSTPRIDKNYAGTGDVFSAVLCGYLLQGIELKEAVKRTADFVSAVTADTAAEDGSEQEGIVFERHLAELTKKG